MPILKIHKNALYVNNELVHLLLMVLKGLLYHNLLDLLVFI